jgi:hypothetical protein
MGYILDYKRWRAVYEAATDIDKNAIMQSKMELTLNDGFSILNDDYLMYGASTRSFLEKNATNKNIATLATGLNNHVDTFGGIKYVTAHSTGLDEIGADVAITGLNKEGGKLLNAMLTAAIGQFTGKEYELLDPNKITWTKAAYTVKFTPDSASKGYALTRGTLSLSGYKVENLGEESSTDYDSILRFMNTYNLKAKGHGSSLGQYDGTADNFTNGYFDFEKTPGANGVGDPLIFFVPSVTEAASATRSEEEIKTEIAGIPAEKQQADVGFETLSSKLTAAGETQVAALAKTIAERFKNKKVETFELISSASPEYNALKGGPSKLEDYTTNSKPTSGKGAPTAPTTNAASDYYYQNAKLAYDRGVSFMTALNANLATLKMPTFTNYQINWQIANQGGPNNDGRYVDLNLLTNETKATVKTETVISGSTTAGATTGGKDKLECVVYYFAVQRVDKKGNVVTQ